MLAFLRQRPQFHNRRGYSAPYEQEVLMAVMCDIREPPQGGRHTPPKGFVEDRCGDLPRTQQIFPSRRRSERSPW
jgi:hypothetical protein